MYVFMCVCVYNFYCYSIIEVPIVPLCPPLPIPSPHSPAPTVNPHTVVHVHDPFIYVFRLVLSPSFHLTTLPYPAFKLKYHRSSQEISGKYFQLFFILNDMTMQTYFEWNWRNCEKCIFFPLLENYLHCIKC